jgi:hypothetical protein
MAAAQRRRYAALRAQAEKPSSAAEATAQPKRTVSFAGKKRIAEAQRKRWAVRKKHAAAAQKAVAAKKRGRAATAKKAPKAATSS